jgi:hypothetical protein
MPGSVPVFREFISSAFADLEEERAALHDRVFPGLRRFCASQGAQFQAIDPRWGVTTEASRDQRAVSICLEEIDRCLERPGVPSCWSCSGTGTAGAPRPKPYLHTTSNGFARA